MPPAPRGPFRFACDTGGTFTDLLIEADDRAIETGAARVVDIAFIDEHTHGFDALAAAARGWSWTDIERESSLTRSSIEAATDRLVIEAREEQARLFGRVPNVAAKES